MYLRQGIKEKIALELFRVLKDGATALISVWGKKSPRLKNKGKECYIPWSSCGNVKRYTYVFEIEEIRELFSSCNFIILKSWEERNINLIVKKPRN
ncbi:hypothetical protein D6829_01425 [Candidatus Pacearchaeota archaeon]|nr:MAG: hypothetical protein D6829_01425 [Candidatus Pacearchaeota archaeon]